MKADAYDLAMIFGQPIQFFIPIFQRPYVWKEEKQWKPLWNDFTTIANHLLHQRLNDETAIVKPHFLGAVVLDKHDSPVGKPRARLVIDGQQRLTTVQIMMMALRDSLPKTDGYERLRGRVEELILNKFVASDEEKLKVFPTNVDGPVYRVVAATESPEELATVIEEQDLNPNSQIVKCYLFFHTVAGKWIEQGGPDEVEFRADALIDAIRQKVRIVVIDMDDEDEAQVIFETLNARGTPLLEADLVKNHVFRMGASEGRDINKLYAMYWQPFEDKDQFWRAEIRQGRLKRPAIELFLQHYLTMQMNASVSATRLFDAFKEWAVGNPEMTAELHLQKIERYAAHFHHFFKTNTDTVEGRFFQRLNIMDTTTVFPFLLGLYERTRSQELRPLRNDVLTILESFLVRRMICHLTTKNYNRLFLDLQQKICECQPDAIPRTVQDFLLSGEGDSVRWPNDSEVLASWLHRPIYNKITQPRLRMILRAIEESMPNSKTEGVYIKQSLTIEHILPQTWEQYWPIPEIEDEPLDAYQGRLDARNQLLQTIGNLTLLTQPLNSGVSNRPFVEKRKEILLYSKLNLNFQLNDYDCWDEEVIQKRGDALWNVAAMIWPYPSNFTKAEEEV